MNTVLRVIIDIFIVGGCFFALAGAVGVVRMPDTFSRMQSSTNITTLGVLLTLVGALLYCIFVWQSWASAAKVMDAAPRPGVAVKKSAASPMAKPHSNHSLREAFRGWRQST